MSVAKERCPAFVCLCGGSPGRGTLASVECFSLRTGTWEALPSMCKRRAGASAGVVAGRLYVCGGGNQQGQLRSVERFDPARLIWENALPLSVERRGAGAGVINERLYICGGADA